MTRVCEVDGGGPFGRPFARGDFKRLFESAPGLYLVLTPALRIAAVSDAYLAATLTRREAILGRDLFEVFPDNPDDPVADGVGNLRQSLERVLATREADSMAVQKYDISRPDGTFEVRFWSPRNFPVLDATGALTHIIHRVEDVTEYVRLREASRDHAQLRTDADRMAAEIVSRSQELHRSNERLRQAEEQLKSLNEDLERRVASRTRELAATNAALTREMAERARAEEQRARAEDQFRQAQKMEALGLLAGGVAHDFNNLLTIILSCAELAKTELPPGHQVLTDVTDIAEAAQRAAQLTRQLLTFSRRHVQVPVVLDLNEVVEQAGAMIRRLLGPKVRFATAPAVGLGAIRVDRGLIDQVLLNLVVNARDAMEDGGTVTVSTGNVRIDESFGGLLHASPGDYVMLAVTDTGCGMNDETRANVFIPFFTTKPAGRGTGLGLSMVLGVMQESRGEIVIHSAPGRGTTFKVLFPVDPAASAAPQHGATVRPRTARLHGTERILLVEDEVVVREVAQRILTGAGYVVTAVGSVGEALALAEASDFGCDLLLTDVVMPVMDGPTLVHHVRQARPDLHLKVLFMSGHTGGALVHQKVLESQALFLPKPFVPSELLSAVREVLDAPHVSVTPAGAAPLPRRTPQA